LRVKSQGTNKPGRSRICRVVFVLGVKSSFKNALLIKFQIFQITIIEIICFN